MPYTLAPNQPEPRDPGVPYDDVAPGLYPGETALRLNDGKLVALSYSSTWLDNGAGVVFQACARWINANGSTKLGPQGQHVEGNASYNAAASFIEMHGVTTIAKELLLLVLGEPPTTIEIPGENGPETVPLIGWSQDVILNASIRYAISVIGDTSPEETADAATLLNL
jgi:hypothetical protein